MPRGLPRTKRTAKPQRGVLDVLQKLVLGYPGITVTFLDFDTVRIVDGAFTAVVPRTMYDRYMKSGTSNGVHILIKNSISDLLKSTSDDL